MRTYLRAKEKEDIMAIACLIGTLESVIDDKEKVGIDAGRNAKMAKTYARKFLDEITNPLCDEQKSQIAEFIEKKKIFFLGEKEATVFNFRDRRRKDFVEVPNEHFKIFMESFKDVVCVKCSGKHDGCIFKTMMMVYFNLDGKAQYENCPFARAEEKSVDKVDENVI